MFAAGWRCSVITAAVAGALHAQGVTPPSSELVRESWTVRDGLPANSVTQLLQGRDGYLWIATFNGLVRYDGVRFTVFDPASTPGLPSARIVRIAEGPDGAIWCITEQGHLVRVRHGRAVDVRGADSAIAGARRIVFDGDRVWATVDRGVARVRGTRIERLATALFSEGTTALAAAPGGTIVVGDDRGTIVHLDSTGRVLRQFVAPPFPGPRVTNVTAIRLERDGELLVGGGFGLLRGRLDRDSLRAVPLPQSVGYSSAIKAFSRRDADGSRFVYAGLGVHRLRGDRAELVAVDNSSDDRIKAIDVGDTTWFAVDNVLYRDGRPAFALPVTAADPLSATRITALLVDREGSIWLGTQARGLHRLTPAVFRTYGVAEGLVTENVYPVAEDRTGRLWLGLWERGLGQFDPATGRGRSIASLLRRDDMGVLNAQTILDDGADGMLVGTNFGLFTCPFDAVTRCRPTGPAALANVEFVALLRDAAGIVWASTHTALWQRDGGTWRAMPWAPRVPVRAVATTPDGARWFATNGAGLVRWHDGRTSRVTTADGLPIDVLRELHVDHHGMLWIGTEGRGLARLDPRAWSTTPPAGATRRIARIGMAEGLPDVTVHRILGDDAGRAWLSTNRGIMRVSLAELRAVADGRSTRLVGVTYTERDGLRNREANGGYASAGVRTRDGRLWFPTQGGLAVVDPRRIERVLATPPQPRLELVATRTRTVRADSATLAFAADERDLELQFTAPSFVEPSSMRFRVRLEGYDADWVDVGTRRSAFYTRVPSGRYPFRVAVADARGTWHEAPAPTVLVVAARWYETWPARVVAVLVTLAGLLAASRWRTAALRARAASLESMVEARTAELRASERELAARNAQLAAQATALAEFSQARTRLFTYLSHEFRTPLTLILGPLQGLLEGRYGVPSAELREQGTLMQRNAHRLLRLVNQILDLARLQTGAMTLDRRPADLVPFVRGVVAGFASLAERRGIALGFSATTPMAPVLLDGEQFERVLLNLVGNALKFTPAAGRVDVTVAVSGETARVVVADTGIGIPADELSHVFERFYRAGTAATRRAEGTGLGLAFVREVVQLHGGDVAVESEPGRGSTFTVTLRVVTAARLVVPAPGEGGDAARLADVAALHVSGEYLALTRPASLPGDAFADEGDDAVGGDSADRTTVLVVDDNADVRQYVRSVLAPTYRVVEAGDGAAALEVARTTLPDLIVADVMMPELDGFGLVRALRGDETTDAIAIVLLTARGAAPSQVEGYEAGADAYLVKPFEPSVLEACLAGLLAQRRRLRERYRAAPAEVPCPVPEEESAEAPPSSPLVMQLRGIVAARLTDPALAPDTLAESAGLSYHQLYRALQGELGWSPSRFIRSVRVECAAELLKQGKGSVTEVAYAVGFESLSYFGRAFRERFGANPGSFAAKGVSAARPGPRP